MSNARKQTEEFSEFFDIDLGGKWTREDVETILDYLAARGVGINEKTEDEVVQDVLIHSFKVRTIDALWGKFGLPRWFGQTAETINYIIDKNPDIIDILFNGEDDSFIILQSKVFHGKMNE